MNIPKPLHDIEVLNWQNFLAPLDKQETVFHTNCNKLIDKEKNVSDTLELARLKYPGSSNSLDNLCKKFNIDLSKRTKHNALLDCELLRKVYINLIDQKEPTLDLKNYEEQKFNK